MLSLFIPPSSPRLSLSLSPSPLCEPGERIKAVLVSRTITAIEALLQSASPTCLLLSPAAREGASFVLQPPRHTRQWPSVPVLYFSPSLVWCHSEPRSSFVPVALSSSLACSCNIAGYCIWVRQRFPLLPHNRRSPTDTHSVSSPFTV